MTPANSAEFAATLRAWRTERGATQSEAAALLNVSRRTLEGWERGVAPATPGPILKLLELLK